MPELFWCLTLAIGSPSGQPLTKDRCTGRVQTYEASSLLPREAAWRFRRFKDATLLPRMVTEKEILCNDTCSVGFDRCPRCSGPAARSAGPLRELGGGNVTLATRHSSVGSAATGSARRTATRSHQLEEYEDSGLGQQRLPGAPAQTA